MLLSLLEPSQGGGLFGYKLVGGGDLGRALCSESLSGLYQWTRPLLGMPAGSTRLLPWVCPLIVDVKHQLLGNAPGRAMS